MVVVKPIHASPNGELSRSEIGVSVCCVPAEGAVVGLAIGYFATRAGGEGPETAGR